MSFSALQRAEIAEITAGQTRDRQRSGVSVLFNEPKLLKCAAGDARERTQRVSVLFNEPKLLKCGTLERIGYHMDMFQCSSTSRNC